MPQVARTVELKSRASSADAVAEWLLGAMRQSAEPPGLKAMFAGKDAADERRFVLVSIFTDSQAMAANTAGLQTALDAIRPALSGDPLIQWYELLAGD
jgi:quinol monooxygenase YgiN